MKNIKMDCNQYENFVEDEFDEMVYIKNFDAICIGKAIKFIRKKYKISQHHAAISSYISQSYLSHVEKGNYSLSFHKLASLSRGMNIPIEEIINQYTQERTLLKDKSFFNS